MDFKQEMEKREEQTGHALMSPSGMQRVIACPASVRASLAVAIPKTSSYAEKGIYLHDITEHALIHGTDWLTNNKTVIQEDKVAVLDTIAYFKTVLGGCGKDAVVAFEHRVSLSPWGLPFIKGTCDASIKDYHSRTLHVFDWKYGKGVPVFAEGNVQEMCYAAGEAGFPSVFTNIVLHLVQPFLDTYDSAKMRYTELEEWVYQTLTPATKTASLPGAPFGPGKKQCQFCPVAPNCKARHSRSVEAARNVFAIKKQEVAIVSNDELARLLDLAAEFNAHIKDIQTYAVAELASGREFGNKKLVSGRSTRQWADEKLAKKWLKEKHKDSELYIKKFITGPAAEKLSKEYKKDPGFQSLLHKPPGKPIMVDKDDKRPALDPSSDAVKVFTEGS